MEATLAVASIDEAVDISSPEGVSSKSKSKWWRKIGIANWAEDGAK